MADSTHPSIQKLIDFQSIIFCGSGMTAGDDARGRLFDERLKSGEFAKSGLEDVAANLMENIRRLLAHASLPMALFNYGRRFQEIYAKFVVEPARTVSDVLSEEQIRDFQARERTWQWIIGNESHYSDIGSVTNGHDVAGFAAIPERDQFFEEHKKKQIDAFGGSLVIEAWTLFESLSEDLWEAAINFHPTVLGALNGKAKISFDDLQKNAFNVRHKMGTLLKRKEAVGFRAINDIRDAYRLAFTDQFKPIEDILNDSGLQYAAAVRNLLIHKRGIIDKEFHEQTAGIADVPRYAPNGPPVAFPLTGETCAKLSDSCRTSACWLVNAVHAWIIGHPDRLPTQQLSQES